MEFKKITKKAAKELLTSKQNCLVGSWFDDNLSIDDLKSRLMQLVINSKGSNTYFNFVNTLEKRSIKKVQSNRLIFSNSSELELNFKEAIMQDNSLILVFAHNVMLYELI